nr:reverse transcriptase domain-containing protein [Tanacetum cinerariifolium]
FENFNGTSSEGLDLIYDMPQKLISQLEIHGENLETLSMDDLYNNLKIYKAEVMGSYSTTQNTQNIAFVSSNSTDSTNKAVNTAHGVSAASFKTNASNLPNVDSLSDATLDSQQCDKSKTGLGYDSQVLENLVNDKYNTGEGYHAVPPPYTGNFMPPKPNLVFADEHVVSEFVTSLPVNEDVQIRALIYGKKIIVTEVFIRRDLQLQDAGGTACLPNDTVFKELARMRKETEVPHTEPQNKESVPKPSNDPLPIGEDRMQLTELMNLCTNLQKQVLNFEKAKTAQAKEIADLKKRVKKLERKKKSRTLGLQRLWKSTKVAEKGVSTADPVTTVGEVVTNAEDVKVTTAAITPQISKGKLTLAQTLINIKATKPKARGVIVQEPSEFRTTLSSQPSQLPQAKDKGKGIMIVEEKSKKTQASLTEDSSKRAGDELEQESAKRQRLEKEDDSTELERCLEIVPKDNDDVTIEATPLFSKSPTIVDYKIYKEGKKAISKSSGQKEVENLAADYLSRLKNPDLGVFTEEEIVDEFPDEHLMILKAELNNDEPWYADYVNYIVGKIVTLKWKPKRRRRNIARIFIGNRGDALLEGKSLKSWHTAILDQLGDTIVPQLLEERSTNQDSFGLVSSRMLKIT